MRNHKRKQSTSAVEKVLNTKKCKSDPEMARNLARCGIARMATLYKAADNEQERRRLATDMEITASEAVFELQKMGGKLEDVDRADAAIERIEAMKQQGLRAVDEDWRKWGAVDLARVLEATLEALAVLAVERRDLGAIRYLAWNSDLGRHRLPSNATKPLEETVKAMSLSCDKQGMDEEAVKKAEEWDALGKAATKAWNTSVQARHRHGKQRTRTALGEWVRKLRKKFEQLQCDLVVDEFNRQMRFPDIPSVQERSDDLRNELDLPVEFAGETWDPKISGTAHLMNGIIMPLLRWIGENPDRQCSGKNCEALWQELVGKRYISPSGGPHWSKIEEQVQKALEV
jgi:hypothetical protein